jgi:hypothetical protein
MYIIDTQTYSIRKVRNCHSLGRYRIADTWEQALDKVDTMVCQEQERIMDRQDYLQDVIKKVLLAKEKLLTANSN